MPTGMAVALVAAHRRASRLRRGLEPPQPSLSCSDTTPGLVPARAARWLFQFEGLGPGRSGSWHEVEGLSPTAPAVACRQAAGAALAAHRQQLPNTHAHGLLAPVAARPVTLRTVLHPPARRPPRQADSSLKLPGALALPMSHSGSDMSSDALDSSGESSSEWDDSRGPSPRDGDAALPPPSRPAPAGLRIPSLALRANLEALPRDGGYAGNSAPGTARQPSAVPRLALPGVGAPAACGTPRGAAPPLPPPKQQQQQQQQQVDMQQPVKQQHIQQPQQLQQVAPAAPPPQQHAGQATQLSLDVLSPALTLNLQQGSAATAQRCAAQLGVAQGRLRFYALTEVAAPEQLPPGCARAAVEVEGSSEWARAVRSLKWHAATRLQLLFATAPLLSYQKACRHRSPATLTPQPAPPLQPSPWLSWRSLWQRTSSSRKPPLQPLQLLRRLQHGRRPPRRARLGAPTCARCRQSCARCRLRMRRCGSRCGSRRACGARERRRWRS